MRAAILGTGLIGASVGAGLADCGWATIGWDPSSGALAGAVEMGGIAKAAGSAGEATEEADLIVLAGPVSAILEGLPRLETDALVTDVAGIKAPVVAAGRHLPHFVGGHPMAGRESSGPEASTAGMFRGATWVLATDGADNADLDRLESIVRSLGANPLRMTADAHDRAVAAVSHVPQVLAAALVNLIGDDPTRLELAAGGFRDVTRIALSEPRWWADVLVQNQSSLSPLMRTLAASLEQWADRLADGATPRVVAELEAARATRAGLTAPVAAVRVLLEDRPGEIARVGHALAESGVDVRDLQLRHATRGGGGVLTLSVYPGQEQVLAEALGAEGFRLL